MKVDAATSGFPKCFVAPSSPPSEVKLVTTQSPHTRRSDRITFQEIILDSYADAEPVDIKQGRRGRGRAFFTVTTDSSASAKSVSAAWYEIRYFFLCEAGGGGGGWRSITVNRTTRSHVGSCCWWLLSDKWEESTIPQKSDQAIFDATGSLGGFGRGV